VVAVVVIVTITGAPSRAPAEGGGVAVAATTGGALASDVTVAVALGAAVAVALGAAGSGPASGRSVTACQA